MSPRYGRRPSSRPETAIDAEVYLHADKGEFFISARLNISIPGVERSAAQALVDDAEKICSLLRRPP